MIRLLLLLPLLGCGAPKTGSAADTACASQRSCTTGSRHWLACLDDATPVSCTETRPKIDLCTVSGTAQTACTATERCGCAGSSTRGCAEVAAMSLGPVPGPHLMSELKGQIALVTSAGSAPLLAFALASRGATVVVAMKDEDRAEAWALRIRHNTGNSAVHPFALDLASPCSVRSGALEFISRYRRLHLLVTDTTARLGPVLLANLLLETMKQSGGGRVIRLPMAGDRQQVWSASVLPRA